MPTSWLIWKTSCLLATNLPLRVKWCWVPLTSVGAVPMEVKDNLRKFVRISSCKSGWTCLRHEARTLWEQWSNWTSRNAAVKADTALTTNETCVKFRVSNNIKPEKKNPLRYSLFITKAKSLLKVRRYLQFGPILKNLEKINNPKGFTLGWNV